MMHRHHGKWIWGLSQLSQSLKALGSSLCQLSYTKQQWINLQLSAPQRKYLPLASTNQVLYITYFSKSPQQYHRVYMIIIINGVHIKCSHVSPMVRFHVTQPWNKGRPKPRLGHFQNPCVPLPACISQVNETICFHPHNFPPLYLQ